MRLTIAVSLGFRRKFKASKFDQEMYDIHAKHYAEHIVNGTHSETAGRCTVIESLEHFDQKWAKEGEP